MVFSLTRRRLRKCLLIFLTFYMFVAISMIYLLNNVMLSNNMGWQFINTADSPVNFTNLYISAASTTTRSMVQCDKDRSSDLQNDDPWDNWVDQWQVVIPKKVYVYSAYLDERDATKNIIKITALRRKDTQGSMHCVVWHYNRTQPSHPAPSLKILPEQAAKNKPSYMAAVYTCTLDKHAGIPYMVSIKSSESDASNIMHIHRNKPKDFFHKEPKYEFTVCLGGPLKFGLKNVHRLTEWIELNSIFGAQQFILYNHSASSELKPYIDYYLDDRKLIQWLPWQFPEAVVTKEKMKNHGHMSFVYDCMYRAMYKSRYVVYMDTDEFIVPRYNNITKWIDLLKVQHCENSSFISFQNVFFKLEWMDDPKSELDPTFQSYPLVTQLKTKKEQKVFKHGARSKYMTRPELIETPGIHLVWKNLRPQSACKVDKSRALVHHYRDWRDPKPGWIEDKFMFRFSNQLLDRVKCVHQNLIPEYQKPVRNNK